MNGTMPIQTYNPAVPMSMGAPAPVPTSQPAQRNPVPMVPASSYGYTQPTYNPVDYNQPAQPVQQPGQNFYGQYMAPVSQAPASPTNFYPTSTLGAPYAPPSTVSNTSHSSLHSFQDYKPDKAWNDPPMVIKKDKPATKTSEPSTPFVAPLYGVPPAGNPQGDVGAPGAPMSNYGNFYNPQEHQAPINSGYQPPQVSQAPVPKPAPEPTPVAPKAPLPAEHQLLKDVLDNLVRNCVSRANNAQMKRKLDDVAKKLDVLYDRLREHALSDSVLQGLHQIVAYVNQNDYNSVLVIISNMVSQGNFSEISTFMPGIKMLIQSATQLQVYSS